MVGYKIPATLEADIEKLAKLIHEYKEGSVDKLTLKSFRVPFGVYEQRDEETYMARIRCPGGLITPAQLKRAAELALKYGNGDLHVTTRQELQIHDLGLDTVIPVIKELKAVGLSTRGGGGNTVRNMLASIIQVDKEPGAFDVLPYAVSLTSRLIDEPDSRELPRKLKITFSGSGEDTAFSTINDLGFIAAEKEGKRGFKVYIAGGMGRKPAVGKLLFDFIPHEEVYNVAKAAKNLFYKYGNRKNRNAARLRFLLEKEGQDGFFKLFHSEYEAVKKENYRPLDLEELPAVSPKAAPDASVNEEDFAAWKRLFIAGSGALLLPVLKGDIKAGFILELTALLELIGENVIRFGKNQNIYLVNIPEDYYKNFCVLYTNYNIAKDYPAANIVACAGASTCKLGICVAKNAVEPILRALKKGNVDPVKTASIRIHISGCPNSCGQHPAGELGFFGGAARNEGNLYPVYHVLTGAVIRDGETKYAEKQGKIAAKDLPDFTKDLLEAYSLRGSSDFIAWLKEEGNLLAVSLLEGKYSKVPGFNEDPSYYFDWGEEELFSLEKRGKGECSTSVMDFVERELAQIKKLEEKLEEELSGYNLYQLLLSSMKMLLPARGVKFSASTDVAGEFKKHFFDTNLVDPSLGILLKAPGDLTDAYLLDHKDKVRELAARVIELYKQMDDSLSFGKSRKKVSKPNGFKDFRNTPSADIPALVRGELEKLDPADLLDIWVMPGEVYEAVTALLKQEGHHVRGNQEIDNYIEIVIKKGGDL